MRRRALFSGWSGRRALLLALAIATLVITLGCASEIGDSCSVSTDCSVQGDRVCDLAQPKGYCTVLNCLDDTCPGGATCVEFRANAPRLASQWCMAPCKNLGDCREGDGYACVTAAELGPDLVVRVVDNGKSDSRFCAAVK